MSTLKKIAQESGFSSSTVSIVLSGKGEERKISQETQAKIFETASRLGYRVNVAARKLRANQLSGVTVSVFIVPDQRASMMLRFLLSLHNSAAAYDQRFDFAVHFYRSGSLHSFAESILHTHCAIICNASEADLRFLDEAQFHHPIVLYNRASEKYCTVSMDMRHIGETVAGIFARRGHKHAVLMDTEVAYYAALRQLNLQFEEIARHHGMEVSHVHEPYGIRGGYNGGIAISWMRPRPDCVFTMSSLLAMGALRAFEEQGIKVPGQLELISLGTDDPDFDEYASVSISTIHIPIDDMARECIRLLLLQLDGKIITPQAVALPVVYTARESCGG